MKNRAGILVLISTGVIIGLLIAEILVRIFLPQNRLTTWIEMHPDGFMMNQKCVTAIHNFNERAAESRLYLAIAGVLCSWNWLQELIREVPDEN